MNIVNCSWKRFPWHRTRPKFKLNFWSNSKSLERSLKKLILNTKKDLKLVVQSYVIPTLKVFKMQEKISILNFSLMQQWNSIISLQKNKESKKELFSSIILRLMLTLTNLSNYSHSLVKLKPIHLIKLLQEINKVWFKEEP